MKMKKILLTETQINRCLHLEGIEWQTMDDGSVNFTINHKQDDLSNVQGNMSVDTRMFGNKENILRGDGTYTRGQSLEQKYNSKAGGSVKLYQSVIDYIKNGRKGNPEDFLYIDDTIPSTTITAVMKWFKQNKSNNYIIDQATKAIKRITGEAGPIVSTYDRISNSSDGDKTARYITGTVNGTNVKYIALFSMKDFNFSDAIKHGRLRQNSNTDKLLGIDKSDRTSGDIPVRYDGKTRPNIAQNFSLHNVRDGHYKQQYQLKGSKYNTSELTATDLQRELAKIKDYTSVNQFIDKSVMYAAYALKKENFIPSYIVAAPSSSKFNDYYCTNLSRKIGVEYVPDFFHRNAINVVFDNENDEAKMRQNGIPQQEIEEFKQDVRNIAFKEISYMVYQPIDEFFNKYSTYFSNMSLAKYSRTKSDFSVVKDFITTYISNTLSEMIQEDGYVAKYLLSKFQKQSRLYNKEKSVNSNFGADETKYDSKHVLNEFNKILKLKGLTREFTALLDSCYKILLQYSEILATNGYRLRLTGKKTKITDFKKHLREYIHNLYVVADEHLTNGNLQKRYANAKFVIFDEDINSGATLKIAIDALQDKLPSQNANNIICLVNGYSASGF